MSSPAKGVEAAKCVRVKLLVRVFFGPLSCNDESARDASRNARFSRIWAFIEHWPASGFALRGESYKRPEVFFLIERMRVRPGWMLEMRTRRDRYVGSNALECRLHLCGPYQNALCLTQRRIPRNSGYSD
jgi:hypothetical protein